MATLARERAAQQAVESWEIPKGKNPVVRVLQPWFQNPVGLFGLIVVIAFIVIGVAAWLFPDAIALYPPTELNAAERLQSPSLAHPFGTTALGQDIFSRLVVGTGVSFKFGFMVLIFGFVPGTALGVLSGYAGRWIDNAIQRSGEAWTAFPQLPILLTVIAAVGPGLKAVVIVVAISALFGGSRLMRAVSLIEKNKEYVLGARSTGANEARLLARHVIPNVMPFILVGVSSVFAIAIIAEATLSFLGLGLEKGTPGWGIDLAEGRAKATEYPHLVIFPGIAISLVVLGFNLMGDTLRDILDPRLRGSTGPKR